MIRVHHAGLRRAALAAVLALVFVAGCGGDGANETSTTDSAATTEGEGNATVADASDATSPGGAEGVILAIGAEPTTLDPHLADDGGERAVNDNVYEALTRRDPDGALAPGLAVELPQQIDDVTWRVTLNEGITFHDGSALDAADVVATVDRVIELADESAQYGSFYSTLESAEVIDELTVELTTNAPDPILPARLYWMKITPEGASERADYSEFPIGTGPYTFDGWDRGEEVRLSANDAYWGGAPDIADVTLRFVPEYGSRLAGLLSGDYDLITNLAPDDADRAPQAVSVGGLEHPIITLNADGGATADVRVRRALNLAVNKEELAEALFLGFAEVDQGQGMSESAFGFNPSIEPYPFDPEQARALLAEAGAEGATVQLVGTSGRWLRDAETVEAVAGYWEQIGLNVDVQILEFGAWLDAWSDREVRPDAVFLNSSNELFDADRTLSALFQAGGIGSSNSDEELSELIDAARNETDTAVRESLYHDAVQRAFDEAHHVYLLRVRDSYGLSERLSWSPRVDAKLIVQEMSLT